MDRATTNGGFPLPLAGEPVRVLASHHQICEGNTRVRVPRAVPARAVRRVVCDRCAEAYEPEHVDEVPERASRRPALLQLSLPSPSWRWLSLPVAGAAVVLVLNAVQGGDDDPSAPAAPAAPVAAAPDEPARGQKPEKVPEDAHLISESTYQLALPPGWERTAPSGGATFAAVAPGGEADAMLWIERDPKLSFAEFEARSLEQLKSLAGSAGTVARNPGPTAETTSITIAPTSAPKGAPNYQVLLRASGNYWYYLATTSQPGADQEAVAAVDVVQGSFLPQGGGR